MKNWNVRIALNCVLAALLGVALILSFLRILPLGNDVFMVLSIIGILPLLVSAARALIKKELTVDLLAGVALIFSFLAKEWYSAAFILLMITSARIFDLWTERRAEETIKKLYKYRPDFVRVKDGDSERDVRLEDVKPGDVVVVESGERIAVDGRIIMGQAAVNESVLTGESEPVVKKKGDTVLSSTLVEAGSLLVTAEKVGADSTLARIAGLIDEASRKKAKTERFAAHFTAWYIVASIGAAVAIFAISRDLRLVLSVLLVVCADDIAVAVPLAYSVGIARGAERGIIIKGSDVLEKLPKVKAIMTDKTGTLTLGKPKIKDIHPSGILTEEFLKRLGMAEMNSKHPSSAAIMGYLKEQGIEAPVPDDVEELPGEGISASREGKTFFAGKSDYLRKNGITLSEKDLAGMESHRKEGYSITALGGNGKFLGFVGMEDALRPAAKEAIRATRALGVKHWIMLTGDNDRVAHRVSTELGVDAYKADLRPEDKLRYIESYKKESREILGMIGDGVNDAAALALADVSVAMGAIGSDAAIEVADVALMKDDLRGIPEAMLLGKKTERAIRMNFILWASTNIIGLILVFGGALTPSGAATYNFLTDFFPIFSSLSIGLMGRGTRSRK